jgi:cyclic-di-GMP-binding protein
VTSPKLENNMWSQTELGDATSIQDRKKRASVMIAMKSFADRDGPLASDRIVDLFDFENRLHPIIQNDKRWFFANSDRLDAVQFARDMHVLHNFGARMMEQVVTRRAEWAKNDQDPLLLRAFAFAFHHHCASIKWCFFRHETVKPQVWPELHGLYRMAESLGLEQRPLSLLDTDTNFKTAITALYLQALLLDVLNTGSLNMPQIEIADSWLAEWTREYHLDSDNTANNHVLFVDLDATAGLQLVTGNSAWPSYRYLQMQRVREQVEAVRAELRVGRPYHGRNVSSTFRVEEHVALLSNFERVHKTLLNASASAIEERRLVANVSADIRLGFAGVRAAISGTEIDFAELTMGIPTASKMKMGELELSLEPVASAKSGAPGSVANLSVEEETARTARLTAIENARWKVHDMSSKGLGLLVERDVGEAVQVGQMIAARPYGVRNWMLGVIVRKLTQRAIGETLLGVELLCQRSIPITLAFFANAKDTHPVYGSKIHALYLPGLEEHGRADTLLLPARDFGAKNSFELTTKNAKYRININRVLRKGDDWVGLRFEVVSKDY